MKSCCKKAVESFWSELQEVLCKDDDMCSWGCYGEIIDVVCKHTGDEVPQWRKDEKNAGL